MHNDSVIHREIDRATRDFFGDIEEDNDGSYAKESGLIVGFATAWYVMNSINGKDGVCLCFALHIRQALANGKAA